MVRACVSACLLSLLALSAHAQSGGVARAESHADVYQGPGPSLVSVLDQPDPADASTAQAVARTADGGLRAVADGLAIASPGRVAAVVDVRGEGASNTRAESYVLASSSDTLTFDRADLTGQVGVATIAFRYDASFAGAAANAGMALRTRFGESLELAEASLDFSAGVPDDPFTAPPGSPPGTLLLTSTFVFGEAIGTFLETYVTGWSGSSEAFPLSFADVALSARWGGVQSVTVGGVAVTGFSVSAHSGLDYSRPFAVAAPVPEPAAVLLGLAGVVLVGVGSRRRPAIPSPCPLASP